MIQKTNIIVFIVDSRWVFVSHRNQEARGKTRLQSQNNSLIRISEIALVSQSRKYVSNAF